uniref:Uncharacterized protein n=1 Tax=viral metagenome TaxID=1070528 RepID=A0A6M3J5D1_9ZZZZ
MKNKEILDLYKRERKKFWEWVDKIIQEEKGRNENTYRFAS